MKRLIHIVLIGLFVIQMSCKKDDSVYIPVDPADIEAITSFELQVFNLINEYRDSLGLSLLELNDTITLECRVHSYNMAFGIVPFGHDGFDQRADSLLTALNANGAAENVAYGNVSVQTIVTGWINSSGHRENIEGDYNLTGIGVVNDAEGYSYYTQIFVNKPN